MNRHFTALLGFALACGGLPPVGAVAVHKWVDEHGVTHYSDAPPDSIDTTLIELPEPTLIRTAGEDGTPADDYYSISNQWQRMNQERIERERLKLERERIRAAQQTVAPVAPAPTAAAYDEVRYVPIYSGFGFKRHHRRHHRYHGGMRPQPRPSASPSLGTFPTQ